MLKKKAKKQSQENCSKTLSSQDHSGYLTTNQSEGKVQIAPKVKRKKVTNSAIRSVDWRQKMSAATRKKHNPFRRSRVTRYTR